MKLGSVVPSGVSVKDKNGTYETTTLPADSSLYSYQTKVVKKSATAIFSQAEILAAQKFTLNFLVTQGMDSIALDNGESGWAAWKKDEAPKYLYPKASLITILLKDQTNGNRSGIIDNDNKNQKSVLTRDGSPRISSEHLVLSSVSGQTIAPYGGLLNFSGTDTAIYRTTKAATIASILRDNPGLSQTRLRKAYPKLYSTSAPAPQIKDVLTYSYNVLKDSAGAWRIGSYGNNLTSHFVNL